MKKLFGSFATRIYVYITLVTVFIFAAISLVEYYYNSRRDYEQAANYTLLQLKDIIKTVDLQMAEAVRNVNFFVPRVMAQAGNPDSVIGVVREMILADTNTVGGTVAFVPDFYEKQSKFFMTYVRLDSIGHVSTRVLDSDTYDYTTKEWYKEALESPAGIWTDPYFDAAASDVFVTTYAMPLHDRDGSVFAVLTADMSFIDFLKDFEALRPYPESFIVILSDDGTYLSHPDTTLVRKMDIFKRADDINSQSLAKVGRHMLNRGSGSQLIDFNGEDALVCYAPLPGSGWSVACYTPYKAVVKHLGLAGWVILVIMLVGLVLLTLSIRLVLKYATRPLAQIVEASHHIAEGDFTYRLPEGNADEDIGKLRNAFNNMQKSLVSYVAELTEITQAHEREQSIADIAETIRKGILPQTFPIYPTRPEADIYGRMIIGKQVSGTLYDFHTTRDHLFFILGDINGSGIMSSILMVVTVSMFRASIIQTDSPARIVSAINSLQSGNEAADFTENIFVGSLDLKTGRLSYCNAGHKWPVLCSPGKAPVILSGKVQTKAGVSSDTEYVNESIDLRPGDVVVGFNEAVEQLSDHLDRKFGYHGVTDAIASFLAPTHNVSLQKLVDGICTTLSDYLEGERPTEDLALMAMAYRQPVATPGTYRTTFSFKSEIGEIPQLSIFINEVSKKAGWDSNTTHKINLVLEEGVSNIISYAYPENFAGEKPVGTIRLSVLSTPGSISFRLVDDGQPYDPTAEVRQAEMDGTLGNGEDDDDRIPANRQALGYFLVHQIMDEVEYCRVDGENQVVMRLYL